MINNFIELIRKALVITRNILHKDNKDTRLSLKVTQAKILQNIVHSYNKKTDLELKKFHRF